METSNEEELDKYKIELIPPKRKLITGEVAVHIVILVWNIWNLLDFQSTEMSVLDLVWLWYRWLAGFTVIMLIVYILDWRINKFKI